jgi:hypothetical protein
MADSDEIKTLKDTQRQTNEHLTKVNESIKAMTKILSTPDASTKEKDKEKTTQDKKVLSTLQGILKAFGSGAASGASNFIGGVKKMMAKYSKIIATMIGVGMVALFSTLDMKKMKEMWLSLKKSLVELYVAFEPIALAIAGWLKEKGLPATFQLFLDSLDNLKVLFTDISATFAGWDKKDWKEKTKTIFDAFKDVGTFMGNMALSVTKWAGELFGIKDLDKKMKAAWKKMMDKINKFFGGEDEGKDGTNLLSKVGGIVTTLVGMFGVGKIFGKTWVGKMLTAPLRLAFRALLFSGGGFINIIANALGIPYRVPGALQGLGKDGAPDGDSKKSTKKPKGSNVKVDPKTGKFQKQQKGIWNAVKNIFFKSKGFLLRVGSALIMPLMSMGPVGWGLLASLAVGGIVFAYWEEISTGADAAFKYMKDSMKDLMGILKNVMRGAKNMAVEALRNVGLDSLADKLAGTIQSDPPPLKTLQQHKDKQEGGARHYKDPKKKLDMTQSEIDELERKQEPLNGTELRRHYDLRMQRSRLNEIINASAVTDDLYAKSNFDKSQTRVSSMTGLGDNQDKVALLTAMFPNINLTSGWRSTKMGNNDMKKLSPSNFIKNYGKYMKHGQAAGAAGSDARDKAIAQIRAAGFISQHEHGNAVDFSYPAGYGPDGKPFSEFNAHLKKAFPGSTILTEGNHVHMSFNKNNSAAKLKQLHLENKLTDTSGVAGGVGMGNGRNVYSVTNNNNNNTSETFIPTSQDDKHAEESRL